MAQGAVDVDVHALRADINANPYGCVGVVQCHDQDEKANKATTNEMGHMQYLQKTRELPAQHRLRWTRALIVYLDCDTCGNRN